MIVSVAFAYHSSKTLSSWKRYKISFYPTNTVQKHSRKHNFSLVFPFKILSLRFVRPLKKLNNLCTCFFRTPTTAFPARKSTSHFINWKKWLVKFSFCFRKNKLPKSKKCLHSENAVIWWEYLLLGFPKVELKIHQKLKALMPPRPCPLTIRGHIIYYFGSIIHSIY